MTACGQVVPDKATGYLTADLDCTGFMGGPGQLAGAAIYLGFRSNLELRGFTVTGGEHGVVTSDTCGPRPLRDCNRNRNEIVGPGTITGTGFFGVSAWNLVLRDITISGYFCDVFAYRTPKAAHIAAADGRYNGVSAITAKLTDCSVIGSARRGVDVDRVIAIRGAWTGNGTSPECVGASVDETCGDVRSKRRPLLRDTTCGTSVVFADGSSWGVCALD